MKQKLKQKISMYVKMRRIISLFVLSIAVISSCRQIEPVGGPDGLRQVLLTADFGASSKSPELKSHVASDGVVYWDEEDRIAVYTTEGLVRTFHCKKVEGQTAVFSGLLQPDEYPSILSIFPVASLGAFDGTTATILYPHEYEYAEDMMLAPMSAMVDNDSRLSFRHVGGMIRISCESVPSDAVALCVEAQGRKIAGEFKADVSSDMLVETIESSESNTVRVHFTSRRTAITFNVPIPVGKYSNISARFVNEQDEPLLEWNVLSDAEVSRADMYVREEPEMPVVNGTIISAESTHWGLVYDATTDEGLAGVPVTDGYTFSYTDENGVYQFVANNLCRAVYLSIPAEYEIPVSSVDGEPAFWKTAKGRNDFALTPRQEDWSEFSILAISDIHFYTRETIFEAVEQKPYMEIVLPDINTYISGHNNVIAINTGDNISNWTKSMSVAREEFAKIKKGGVTVPMFNAIGNHDFSNAPECNSTYECSQDYFDVFGPTEYSLNIGKAHIVFLNNIIYAGHQEGGYGQSMSCEYGVTDEVYAWLEADLNAVADKQDKILIMCMHAPIFNNQFLNYDKIRALLKTFGESHIISGHNHNNVRREFSNSWVGLSGNVSEEHNINPLSSYWLNDYANDGTPNGYHLFKISRNHMSEQHFKAIGVSEAECQFRIYDGSEVYHDPIADSSADQLQDKDGLLYFDWKTLFDNESFDVEKSFIVRVFDAGTRALDCKVYYVQDGVSYEMTRVKNAHRDQWSFYELWFYGWQNNKFPSVYHKGGPSQNFWYYQLPTGKPSGQNNWKVQVVLNGRTYESSTISTKRNN